MDDHSKIAMWTPQSMLSILTFSFLFSTFVQIASSSVFNLFGSRPLAIPRSYEPSKPRSLMIRYSCFQATELGQLLTTLQEQRDVASVSIHRYDRPE